LTIDAGGFEIEPLHADNRCTPYTVSAHLLYENADPFRLKEPGVTLVAEDARYEALDERRVRVTGSSAEANPYTMKLEGSGPVGYRTMIFSAIADPRIMARIDEWLTNIEGYLREGVRSVLGVEDAGYRLELRPYGWNALGLRPREAAAAPHEVGVMTLVSAPTQDLATEIAKFCNPVLLHYPLEPADPLPSFAFPFSPAEVELGPQYEFMLNHVVELDDPLALSRTRWMNAGPEAPHAAAR
jgi:hypothetical protein